MLGNIIRSYISRFKPSINSNLQNPPDLQFSDLINIPNRSWNSSLIQNLFDNLSERQILNIHLPQNLSPEHWIWAPTPSGQFLVKSTHELVIQDQPARTSPFDITDWNCLWSLNSNTDLNTCFGKLCRTHSQ